LEIVYPITGVEGRERERGRERRRKRERKRIDEVIN